MPLDPVVKPPQLMIQRIKDNKRRRLVLVCVLLSALMLLTIGLRDVNLKTSAPIDFEQHEADSGSRLASLALNRAFIVVTVLLISFMLLLILPYTFRKRGMAVLFFLSILAYIFYLSSGSPIQRNLPESMRTPPGHTDELTPPAVHLTPAVVMPPWAEFHPPQFSKLSLYLISLAVTFSLIFIVWMIYRWRQSQASPGKAQLLEEIGEAARLTLDDLAAGRYERDAVINCYARMSDIVMHSHHIERGVSRTATEFAARLESAGLPRDSVHRLTRLFEAVRYGAHAPQSIEIEEARGCLADIARYCGEKV